MRLATAAAVAAALLAPSRRSDAEGPCFVCRDCEVIVDWDNEWGNGPGNAEGCIVPIVAPGGNDLEYVLTQYGRGCDSYGVPRGAVACVNHPVRYPNGWIGSSCELVGWGCCETVCDTDHCREDPVMPAPPPQESARRRITTSERLAERVRDAMRLGPDLRASFPPARVIGQGELVLADGGLYRGPTESRKRPWALSALEVLLTRKDLGGLHAAMDHAAHGRCAQALARRIRVPDEGIRWSMLLHLEARDGQLAIDDVDADWPSPVDAEARSCYAAMFLGMKAKWPKTESLWVEYPVCLHRAQP